MTIKFDKWELIKTKNGRYAIFYEPGIIGDTGGMIYVSENVYNQAKNGNHDLKFLFDKYNLYEAQNIMTAKNEKSLIKESVNTSNKFYGKGFIVTMELGKYYIKYQLAQHGGGIRKFEISKKMYEDARSGNYTIDGLFKKYNLYHLDVPENDVK